MAYATNCICLFKPSREAEPFLPDPFTRVIYRCLRSWLPNLLDWDVAFTVQDASAIGWSINNGTTHDDVFPGVPFQRHLRDDLALGGYVAGQYAHDDQFALFLGALTHVSCGHTVVRFPERLVILRVPLGPSGRLDNCVDAGPSKTCDCALRLENISRKALSAIRLWLTGNVADIPPLERTLIPRLDNALGFLSPPRQFLCEFAEHPSTTILFSQCARIPPPMCLPKIGPSLMPPGTFSCTCPPIGIGNSLTFDDEIDEMFDNSDFVVLEEDDSSDEEWGMDKISECDESEPYESDV